MGDFNVAPLDKDIGITDDANDDGYARVRRRFFQKNASGFSALLTGV